MNHSPGVPHPGTPASGPASAERSADLEPGTYPTYSPGFRVWATSPGPHEGLELSNLALYPPSGHVLVQGPSCDCRC